MAWWVSGVASAWDELRGYCEGEVGANDYALAFTAALLFPPARYLLDRTVFTWVGRKFIAGTEPNGNGNGNANANANARRAHEPSGQNGTASASTSAAGASSPSPAASSGRRFRLLSLRRRKKDSPGKGCDAEEAGGPRDGAQGRKHARLFAGKGSQDTGRGCAAQGEVELSEAEENKLRKFKESTWKAVVYGLFSIYGFYVTSSKPWFWDRSQFWQLTDQNDHHCPHQCAMQPWPQCSTAKFTADVKLYYILELGFYIQGVVSLLYWETRRKDFKVMMGHHVVTIILITYSHYARLLRIGSMVFLLHDLSDVPMETAKALKYLRMESATTVFLGVFFLVWTMTRLVYFPLVIIRAAMLECKPNCPTIDPTGVHFVGFNGLLLLLLSFHIYWTYLILRIVYKTCVSGRVNDVREDDRNDDEERTPVDDGEDKQE